MLVVVKLVARHCCFHLWSLHVTLMHVGRESELVLLNHDISITAIHAVAKLSRDTARIASHTFLLVGDDVENATHSFGIILCAWIGEYLDVLDYRGRYCLQSLLWIAAEHCAWLAVHIYLEAAAAIDLDVVFAIDCHHWHLAEHLEHSVGL